MLPMGQIKQYARLVILESDPVCTMYPAGKMMEGDVVTFMCEVSYKGYLYPQMKWTLSGDDIHNFKDDSVPGEIKKTSVTLTLTSEHHAKTVTVRTFFSKPKEIESDANNLRHWASNAPVYEHTHVFPQINLFSSPGVGGEEGGARGYNDDISGEGLLTSEALPSTGPYFCIAPKNAAVKKDQLAKHTFHCTFNTNFEQMNKTGKVIYGLAWRKSSGMTFRTLALAAELLSSEKNQGYELYYNANAEQIPHNLKVPLASLEYATNYSCQFISSSPLAYNYRVARLVILESDPVCTMTPAGKMMEGDVVTFMCEVRYQNYPYPQMKWTLSGNVILNFKDESVPGEIKKTSVTLTLTSEHRAKTVTVQTFFSEPPDSEDKNQDPADQWATNAPAYEHTHVFPPMKVSYGPRNVVISPGLDVFTPYQVLTCSADANPPVDTYIWTDNNPYDSKPNILREGPDAKTIVLTSNLLDRDSVTFRCTVRNSLINQETKTAFVEHTFCVLKTTRSTTTTTTPTPRNHGEGGGGGAMSLDGGSVNTGEGGGNDNIVSGGGGNVESGGGDNIESGGGDNGGGGGRQAQVTSFFKDEKISEALKNRTILSMVNIEMSHSLNLTLGWFCMEHEDFMTVH